MKQALDYINRVCDEFAGHWNQFWFQPTAMRALGRLRIAIGIGALLYLFGFTFHLLDWFGADGLTPLRTVREIAGPQGSWIYRASLFYISEQPAVVWAVHLLALAVTLAATCGWRTGITVPLAWLLVLSHIHRAPMLSGPAEPVLCMALLYIAVGYLRSKPHERMLSLDAHLANRGSSSERPLSGDARSVTANIGIRLVQVHLSGLYLLMALTKLSGEIWWNGEAVWSLIASTETSWLNPEAWGTVAIAINLWTHGIVLFEFLFAVLIWIPLFRPLLLVVGIPYWLSWILLTGNFDFSLVMLAANLAFLSGDWQFGSGSASSSKTPAVEPA